MVEIGNIYSHLKVIKLNNENAKGKSWVCVCSCGKEVVLSTANLLGKNGRYMIKSCGCKERLRKGLMVKNKNLYYVWYHMNTRCHDSKSHNYYKYGAKGITVCDEWRTDFEAFLNWSLTNGYKEGLTIDRIDSKKLYSPQNCRWVDYYVQMLNRGLMKTNTTGHSGITVAKDGKFIVNIKRKNIPKYLGSFVNLDEAIQARKKAEKFYEEHGTIENYIR